MESIDKYVPDFSNYITGKIEINFPSFTWLISEENIKTSSAPLIATLIPYYLKNNLNVILIVCQESLHHYSTISRKYVIIYKKGS